MLAPFLMITIICKNYIFVPKQQEVGPFRFQMDVAIIIFNKSCIEYDKYVVSCFLSQNQLVVRGAVEKRELLKQFGLRIVRHKTKRENGKWVG